MNVYIIGSLEQESDIAAVADYFREREHNVRHVYKRSPYTPFDMIVDDCFQNIKLADLVVAVKKPDDTFGQGTTYELAYAKAIGKNYRYVIPVTNGTHNLVTRLTEHAIPSCRKEDYTLVRYMGCLYLVDKDSEVVFEQPAELPETIY